MNSTPVVPRDSASILVIRDGIDGIEVLMTERPSSMGFAAGALVFPGGKLDTSDSDPYFQSICEGACEDLHLRIAVIRELFEETSLFLWEDVIDHAALRDKLDVLHNFKALCNFAKPKFQPNDLLYFSRWVTPQPMPIRFDTRFYLARAPYGQMAMADNYEIVRAEWMRPLDVLDAEKQHEVALMFPTRMNLTSLARFETVDEAFLKLAQEPIVTVEPTVIERDGKIYLQIPPVEGYGLTEIAREDIGEFMRQHGARK